MDILKYFEEVKAQKQIDRLARKFKDKKILLYGAGEYFKILYDNYDLSKLNIIGISDKKFSDPYRKKEFLSYKTIAIDEITRVKPDCIFVSVLKYSKLVLNEDTRNIFVNSKIKNIPIVQPTLFKKLTNFDDYFNDANLLLRILKNLFNIFPSNTLLQITAKIQLKTIMETINIYKKRYQKTRKKLIKDCKKRKIKVAFLCADFSRWKCQYLYDLLKKSENFEPVILMTRLYVSKNNPTRIQDIETFKYQCECFKNAGMKIEVAYDIKKEKYISLKKFKSDYVFYQLPFYCSPIQKPEETSKYALTSYVPYYVAPTMHEAKSDIIQRNYLNRYYQPYESAKQYYSSIMYNNGENIRVTGHPSLDFYKHNKKEFNCEKPIIIYAPHHSMEENSPIKLSTFLENGEFILEFAKQHLEYEWIFRPHPLHKNVLKTIWGEEKTQNYYEEWEKIGIYDHDTDYLPTFLKSYALITDCGFGIEYFMTGNPIIQTMNKKAIPYDDFNMTLLSKCYMTHNNDELKNTMDMLFVNKKDPKKQERLDFLESSGLKDNYASLNIMNDMKQELKVPNYDNPKTKAFNKYLISINFDKYYQKLISRLKNKKIIIYGAGQMFEYINNFYDLSKLNIIGISDLKYTEDDENNNFAGYKIICKENIIKYKPDCVLIAVQNYDSLIQTMNEQYKKEKIKIVPLAKKPTMDLIKAIWNIV